MNFNKELLAKITTRLNYDIIKPLLDKYEINTTNRLAGFFAQVGHESSDFRYKKESFKYSADRLLKIFPKYFKTIEQAQKAVAEKNIAEIVYGGRKDLRAAGTKKIADRSDDTAWRKFPDEAVGGRNP